MSNGSARIAGWFGGKVPCGSFARTPDISRGKGSAGPPGPGEHMMVFSEVRVWHE